MIDLRVDRAECLQSRRTQDSEENTRQHDPAAEQQGHADFHTAKMERLCLNVQGFIIRKT